MASAATCLLVKMFMDTGLSDESGDIVFDGHKRDHVRFCLQA